MEYKLVGFCEIEPAAIRSYCAIHDVSPELNIGDISKVDANELSDFDLMTWGFPCQDISLAGKQKGILEGERSGLYFEGLRILKAKKPKVSIIENVENLVSSKFQGEFGMILKDLDEAGYNSYFKVLNAVDYGTPQRRKRVFVVSIRKDVDMGDFKFPDPIELKFDLSWYCHFRPQDDLTFNFYKRYMAIKNNNATRHEFIEYIDSLPVTKGTVSGMRMGLYNFGEMDFITIPTGITGTLTCRNVQNYNKKYWCNHRLYKPSPRMCYRLMGFRDSDFDKVEKLCTDKELYNQAGNSIVVGVAQHLLREVFRAVPMDAPRVLSLFSGIGAFEKALKNL